MKLYSCKHSVLIVDDESEMLDCFEKFLKKNNLNCTISNNAVKALKLLELYNFEVIVTDINMPKMNGFEFFNKVREFDNNLPVILISGYTGYDAELEAAKLRAYKYLAKPVDLYLLLESITKAIDNYSNSIAFYKELVEENLSVRQLDAIKLFYKGFNYKTIADNLGIAERSVRNRIHQGKEKLKIFNNIKNFDRIFSRIISMDL